ncbi:hypothetical protein PInf_012681 [Phytophthora infestans]|nr:hypothetical protein PInf_012681 [Phytophthora infestans]
MATSNPEIEYISLAVAVNTTDDAVIIKRDGVQCFPSADDQRYFLLVQRDDAMDSANRVVLSITPSSIFSGILQLAISVSSIGFVENAIPFSELNVESSTIRQVEIEWIPESEPLEKPVTAGEAVYRSLSTQLEGNVTLSFAYQMSSEFSSIRTDVILNTTEIRQVWSSESVAASPGQWKYVDAFIGLSYASTAEIVFRGVVPVDSTLYLKSISLRDYTQESKVGDIEFVRATGGMIYIEVYTAPSISDPVLLRAHVKQAGSAGPPALRFAGDGLQYRGCMPTTTMYPCNDSSGISLTSLGQCRTLCTAVETQLRFTSESIVRSAQMVSLSIDEAFTIEFWVYLEHLSLSSSDQQLLLLYGSQDGSLSITLNSYLLISRCQNELRVPRGLPLQTWTHLAVIFSASHEVTVLMNGVEMATGRLSKENCKAPAYAYLQLGRDTMDIRPETSVLQGAMDEIRIWKTAREPADVFALYQKNIAHSDLILVLPFNAAHKTHWYSSGVEGNHVDFIVQNGEAYDITKPLTASTSNVTVPGKVDYVNAAELSDWQLEIYWSPSLLPSVAGVTGGAVKLELQEPLDTGGLPFAQYNVFLLHDGTFHKLTSITASKTNEKTTFTATRDMNGNPLLPLTTYTLKVLALQANAVCDTLTGEELESDAVSATTGAAAIPAPPSRPVLLLASKCSAMITIKPPDDFGGVTVTGMTIGIFLSSGDLHDSLAVTLAAGEISLRNLLAYTSYVVKAALNTTKGDSGFGEALSFTTKDPGPPGKLTMLEITDLGSSSLLVRWNGPQDTGGGAISGYFLYQRAIVATGTQNLIYSGSSDASKTSFLVGGLLARTKYLFSVVPVNQYGLAGTEDENVVYATTHDHEAPFPPTDIHESRVDAGYVELSFSEPFYTGGFPTRSLQYNARLQSLLSCFDDTSGCSTCSHALNSDGDIVALDATSNVCRAAVCSDSGHCCLTGGVKCGIRMLEEKKCVSTDGPGICRIEGLHFTTTYLIALATVNDKGNSSYSSGIMVTTSGPRRPSAPHLELISATGGSISLKWSLPEDTGGASIVRMSLSVDGDELFGTESALSYTHCGGLQQSTDYMYTIEIENAAGVSQYPLRCLVMMVALVVDFTSPIASSNLVTRL